MELEIIKLSIKDVFFKRKIQFIANFQLVKTKRESTNQNLNQNLQIFQVEFLKSTNNLHKV
jgi:hypothetical protein